MKAEEMASKIDLATKGPTLFNFRLQKPSIKLRTRAGILTYNPLTHYLEGGFLRQVDARVCICSVSGGVAS